MDTSPRETDEQITEKRAARTVIVDNAGLFAILEVGDGDYYKIPGGGIEEGESIEQAAAREAREEAGVEVELLGRLSDHAFHEQHPEKGHIVHHSVCFLAKMVGPQQATSFDDWEQSLRFKLHWWDFDTATAHFKAATPTTFFGEQINPRDYAYLLEGKRLLDAQGSEL